MVKKKTDCKPCELDKEAKKASSKNAYCVIDSKGEVIREYPNKADAESYATKIGGKIK